ncbi:MAG: transcription-repair coupling factor [Mariprofundaceae bacterium]
MTSPTLLSSPAGLAWQLSKQARLPGLHVYICPDVRSYRNLIEELAFFLQNDPTLLWRFPAWEVLPYDRVSPHHSIVGERFATLGRLLNSPKPQGLLITALPAWLQRIAPPETVAAHVWQLQKGQSFDISKLKEKLAQAGMESTERVVASGEFAARGGLLDIWPATEDLPLRIDLFGDEIESIRHFDPETQRSTDYLDHFTSVPVREIILDPQGQECFTAAFRARFPQHRKHPMLSSVQAGRPHPGIEALLPLVYKKSARLLDYLPKHYELLAAADISLRLEAFSNQLRSQFNMVRASSEPIISPQELYAIESKLEYTSLTNHPSIKACPTLEQYQQQSRPLHNLLTELESKLKQGFAILLMAHGLGQKERMSEALASLQAEIPHIEQFENMPQVGIASCIGSLESGFSLHDEKIIILTGKELLGQRLPRKRGRGTTVLRADVFTSLAELKIGDPIVHEDHGIGRYLGLESMGEADSGDQGDFIKIAYAGDSQVFIPVEDLDRLHRYTGDDSPTLNKLGSEKWKKTRQRVQHDLLSMAHELIETEANRSRSSREPYHLEGELLESYEEFSARFPFEETDDQVAAIDAVTDDLSKPKPMDRVVCGDVGFGKTEVAMRAAFIVAAAGKQVAILAPTTVLANQHYSNFTERFSGTGLKVALISRLQGKKDSDQIMRELEHGEIRVIIGTHRLLSDHFKFADLGLTIVDEEQRFGVKHKQKLKSLHADVDLLTLTATPIPRTLHQTLAGLRTVSIISTPPAEREAIRTMVTSFDGNIVNEAIRRELYRGGQVYYLHNHVQSIDRITKRLREQIPEAEIGIAHGQMSPAALDRQMMDFYEGRLHILVCTTIVESGLDVPNANTLIVERADLLGLAQLHQIRGRVGRSHRQAYAYLFTPDARALSANARERLQAIAEYSQLGSGFLIARQDMEIRGAGNLLGAEQSGKIEEIGLDMYMDMLAEAVAEARGTPLQHKQAIDIRINMNAILPPDYIPQPSERLNLYRRIARADSDEKISLLFEEMIDRFGKMPEPARITLELSRLRWRAQNLHLSALQQRGQSMRFDFTDKSPIDPAQMMQRVQQQPKRFRLTPDGHLNMLWSDNNEYQHLKECIAFMDELLDTHAS